MKKFKTPPQKISWGEGVRKFQFFYGSHKYMITMSDVKTSLNNLVICANDVGFKVNVGKTKLMHMNWRADRRNGQICLLGDYLKDVVSVG